MGQDSGDSSLKPKQGLELLPRGMAGLDMPILWRYPWGAEWTAGLRWGIRVQI